MPQGLGVWSNWNGGSEDLFLVGMHHRDEGNNDADADQSPGGPRASAPAKPSR